MTKLEFRVLGYLKRYIGENGYAPSFANIMEGCDISSKANVFRVMRCLEEKGYIRRLPRRSRAIEIIENPHLPDAAALSAISNLALAEEAERRGLVLGHIIQKGDGARKFVAVKSDGVAS